MKLTFPKFTLDIDIEKTKDYYATADIVSKSCACSGCRNYEKAIDILPNEVVSFFSQLGVEMKKIREAYVNCTNADGTVFYGGFYHVCGQIVDGESAWVATSPTTKIWDGERAYAITYDFRVSCHNDCALLDTNFPLPAVQIEIAANIPWILAEKNDYA